MSLIGDIFTRIKSVLNLKDFFNAIDNTGDLANGCNSIVNRYKGAEEDNIVPAEGSATLSGISYQSLNNTIPSYCRNMTGVNLQSDVEITPDQLSPTRHVAYDIVLLSKTASLDTTIDYNAEMNFYRDYCNKNGIDFNNALMMASMELQSESAVYNQKANQIVGKTLDARSARDLSYNAHTLLLQANPDFQDEPLRGIEAYGISYEDTYDSAAVQMVQAAKTPSVQRTGIENAPTNQMLSDIEESFQP